MPAHRFERGVDPELPRTAIERATRLIVDIAGGRAGPGDRSVAVRTSAATAGASTLRRARLARVLGMSIDDAEVERILRALGLAVGADRRRLAASRAPTRRFDLAIEEDLIEEIARIHGYDAIPTTLPGGATRLVAPERSARGRGDRAPTAGRARLPGSDQLRVRRCRRCSPRGARTDGAVALANPLSAELGVMRTALLPGLVVGARAQPRAPAGARAPVRTRQRVQPPARTGRARRVETLRIAAVACGDAAAEQWGERVAPGRLPRPEGRPRQPRRHWPGATLDFGLRDAAWGHPGRSADVFRDGQRIGWIGQLHPRLQRSAGPGRSMWSPSNWTSNRCCTQACPTRARCRAFRPSAATSRSSSPMRCRGRRSRRASEAAAGASPAATCVLFDRYVGKGVETGFKSLAMGLILQDESRTLTDRDVDAVGGRRGRGAAARARRADPGVDASGPG